MAPNVTNAVVPTGVLDETDNEMEVAAAIAVDKKQEKHEVKLVWRNILLFAYLHGGALYGLYCLLFSASIYTTLFSILLYQLGGLGITAGAHRLWAHRSYKAKAPLRAFLVLCNTLAFQDAVVDWARDHRVHHKYSETDADPHNAKRGFFFSHVGWLLCRKHPDIKRFGKLIDLSDLYADPILKFQKDFYLVLMPIVCFVAPTWIPMHFWGETFVNAFSANLLRYTVTLNATWLVNSAAHMFGLKPYDRFINPAENLFVALFALGEGWHNYHHTFPWDYKTSELGRYRVNTTCAFIDAMAKIGQAYDLKTVSQDVVDKRAERTGDGSHDHHHHHHEGAAWGWGDADVPVEHKKEAVIMYQLSN